MASLRWLKELKAPNNDGARTWCKYTRHSLLLQFMSLKLLKSGGCSPYTFFFPPKMAKEWLTLDNLRSLGWLVSGVMIRHG